MNIVNAMKTEDIDEETHDRLVHSFDAVGPEDALRLGREIVNAVAAMLVASFNEAGAASFFQGVADAMRQRGN